MNHGCINPFDPWNVTTSGNNRLQWAYCLSSQCLSKKSQFANAKLTLTRSSKLQDLPSADVVVVAAVANADVDSNTNVPTIDSDSQQENEFRH